MSIYINKFKAWLADEMKRNSKCEYKEILEEIDFFCQTDDFDKSYKTWMKRFHPFVERKPLHIKRIYERVFK